MADAAYTKETRNTVRRHRERGQYDFATVHSIVNQASILHVSFLPTDPLDDPFPTILPMIGSMGLFSNPDNDPGAQPLDLYIHGHSASRLMRLPTSQGLEQVPVCVAATMLDGIKLALTPFNHSCNYRSAVLHGYASIVADEAEKSWALALITDGLVPDRWDNSRVPPTKAEMTSTTVLKVSVVSASAKVNSGEPGDDRKDLKDDAVTSSVWTGVLPVHEQIGAPQPSSTNKVAKVPQYLDQWWQAENTKRETYAHDASRPK
ncbi:hypothetical protein IWX90DRAFT_257895 [Phyllosticta citrichinensis]|uniref:Flavin-nucleotide-binding protein n=1 Tax=Phyllosticta citrichinensis TaxID=1130410 RepID=A0ABR1XRY9_9PEZI